MKSFIQNGKNGWRNILTQRHEISDGRIKPKHNFIKNVFIISSVLILCSSFISRVTKTESLIPISGRAVIESKVKTVNYGEIVFYKLSQELKTKTATVSEVDCGSMEFGWAIMGNCLKSAYS